MSDLQVLVRGLRPRARLDEGLLAQETVPLGLLAQLYDLFPDSLVDSELPDFVA